MEAFRRVLLAWVFALISAMLFVLSFPFALTRFHTHDSVHMLLAFVPITFLLMIAGIFGMAWWTSWMKKSSARAWGVAASLLCMFAPLSSMYLFHHPFGNARYEEIVFGLFGPTNNEKYISVTRKMKLPAN